MNPHISQRQPPGCRISTPTAKAWPSCRQLKRKSQGSITGLATRQCLQLASDTLTEPMAIRCVGRVLPAPDQDSRITPSMPFLSSSFCQCLPNEKQNNSQVLATVTNFYMQNYFYSQPGVQRPDHNDMVLHQPSCVLPGLFWIYAPLIALACSSVSRLTSQSPQGSDEILDPRSGLPTGSRWTTRLVFSISVISP